jgi:hypothetical protein
MSRFEAFKNLAAAIQSLIIALGVLVGGIWALYRFRTLKTIEKAQAELERAKRELASRGILEVRLEASQLTSTDGFGGYIHLLMTLKNVGSGTEVIRWSDSRIEAALVMRNEDDELNLEEPTPASALGLNSGLVFSTITPEATDYYAFIIPVQKPGIYLLDVRLSGSPTEVAASRAEGKLAGVEAENLFWGTSTYFRVI